MSEVMDYKSRVSDPASRKFETFSYLPPMDSKAIRKQVEYLVQKGWNPAIEHVEPEHVMDSYWYMWKLPMFGCTDGNQVVAEVQNCRRAFPESYIRLVGFDPIRQVQVAGFLVNRPRSVKDYQNPSSRSV